MSTTLADRPRPQPVTGEIVHLFSPETSDRCRAAIVTAVHQDDDYLTFNFTSFGINLTPAPGYMVRDDAWHFIHECATVTGEHRKALS